MTPEEAGFLDRLGAVLEEAALAAWRRRQVTVLAVLVIAITLALPGLAAVVLARAASALDTLSQADRVRAFLEVGLGPEQAEAVRREAGDLPGAARATLITEDQARASFVGRYPELQGVVDEFAPDELTFPASVEVESDGDARVTAAIAADLGRMKGVEDVRQDESGSEDLAGLRVRLRGAALLAGSAVLVLAAFGVGSVVRMGALSRREELGIMRLVGAPRLHVRAPLILEGALQGALGGLVAALLIDVLTRALAPALSGVLPAFTPGVGVRAVTALVLGAGLAGLVAAAVAVELVLRRHARLER